LLTTLLLLLFAAPAFPGGDLEWESDFAEANGRAFREQRVVFVAVHSDDEARSRAFWKHVYKDKRVRALAEDTVNLLACLDIGWNKRCPCAKSGGLDHDSAKFVEAALREELLGANAEGVIASPQHLWLDPNGAVLLCVPYELSADELSWCFAEAARLAGRPQPEVAGGRAPLRLLYGQTYAPRDRDDYGRGLRPEELEQVLAELKSSGAGRGKRGGGGGAGRFRSRVGSMFQVAFTDEEDARDFITVELSSGWATFNGGDLLAEALQVLGALVPGNSWTIFEHSAGHRDALLRNQAAVALEQLRAPRALKLIKTALKHEKDAGVLKNWVRALGASGRADKGARRQLLQLSQNRADVLRRNALFALGWLAPDGDVSERLVEALGASDAPDARAAACAMALSREQSYMPALESRLAGEGLDDDLRGTLESALTVLKGADLAGIESAVRDVCRDTIPRRRVFFRGMPSGEDLGDGR
jgi:hypothetical protein